MKRITLLGLAFVMLATVLPGSAADGRGCGDSSSGADTCTFAIAGAPITVFGQSLTNDPSRVTSVRVWISPVNPGLEVVPLLACESTGPGPQSCSAGLPDETTESPTLLEQHRLVRLACHVEVEPKGTYWCNTGPRE